jgi:hypothetical protein
VLITFDSKQKDILSAYFVLIGIVEAIGVVMRSCLGLATYGNAFQFYMLLKVIFQLFSLA